MQFLVSSELIGCFESLQGSRGKLLDAPLGQEGAFDGLELWSWLGVLQGRVGGCHCTLCINSSTVSAAQTTDYPSSIRYEVQERR